MMVTMVALSLGVQRQVETPFHALSLLNNIEVRPEERKGKERPPRLTDDKLAEMEKLPGVAAAYPDAHVKNIHLSYRGKETTAIGLAMPSEVALLGHLTRNPHRRPLTGRRRRARNDHWHHGSDCPGVPYAARRPRQGDHRRGRRPDRRRPRPRQSRPRAAESDCGGRLPGAGADGPRQRKTASSCQSK